MSFLNHYLKKHRLDQMPEKMKERVEKAEQDLNKHISQAKGPMTFEDCLKVYGDDIADLVERISNHIKDRPPLSFSSVINTLKFVYSISTEAWQIVDAMSDCVIDDSMSEEDQREAKIEFGKRLVYFIWLTADPFGKKLSWLPFKKTIEKAVVRFLSELALEAAIDFFDAQGATGVQSFATNTSKNQLVKALS